jgi:hypothetical protein
MFSILNNRSYLWKKCRDNHILNNPTCAACGRNKSLQVHHIEPVHLNPKKELDTSNLITLCKLCHFHIGHLMDWKSWNKEVIKDCEVYLDKVKNKPFLIRTQSNENFSFVNRCLFFLSKYFRWNY